MHPALFSLFASLALTTLTPAQCLFNSVTADPVGPSCNWTHTGFCAVAAMPPFLTTELDVANCQLHVTVTAFEGCGASIPFRVLAIGFQPTFLPLPEFGPDCALQLVPAGIATTTSPTVTLDLPPGVSQLSFLAQGAAYSTFPFAPAQDIFAFTSPNLISLQ